jgi:hypothetical protein
MTQRILRPSFSNLPDVEACRAKFSRGKNSKVHTAALPIAGDTFDLIFLNVS